MNRLYADALPKLALILILVLAAALRLQGVAFGLPALYDPDEPIFVLCALKLLRDHTLNPGWFGHPGSTTIYVMALIEGGVATIGHLDGRFPTASSFVDALYHDPGTVFLPGRIFCALCGVACVALTYLITRRIAGRGTSLLAAGIIAINALHIQWSQVIRTDVHASVFMLASIWFAVRVAEQGRYRDYAGAAIMAGFACATKWPAATVIVALIAAGALRIPIDRRGTARTAGLLAALLLLMVAATLAASPYLLLDYPAVAANLGGEAQTSHLGATGGTVFHNIGWYLEGPLAGSFGILGIILAGVGLVAAVRSNRVAAATIVTPALVFFVAISAQRLIWARWVVPILPLLAILLALGCAAIAAALRDRMPRRAAYPLIVAMLAVMLVPIAAVTRDAIAERRTDTRDLAAAWVRTHATPGETIAVEHFAFDLIQRGYRIAFPAGQAGCVDIQALLSRRFSYKQIGSLRGNVALADFGTVSADRLATCQKPFIVTADLDRYLAEAPAYPHEINAYATILAGSRLMAVFRPVPGAIGGPTVRIYKQIGGGAPSTYHDSSLAGAIGRLR